VKVVHLSSYDLYGGAAKAAFRLHEALRESGLDSTMLVRRRDSSRSDVRQPGGAGMKLWLRAQRRCDRLPLVFKGPPARMFSPGWVPDGLVQPLRALQPDIVHLHWVADGFFQVESLRSLNVPVVWTMHDMWPFTGGCHHAGGCDHFTGQCGHCPLLGGRGETDLSRAGWMRRQHGFAGRLVSFVAPSRWLAGRARQSSLLKGESVRVIANGVDPVVFSPQDRGSARRRWGLPSDKLLVLAGSAQLRNPFKGFSDFLRCMQLLRGRPDMTSVEVVLFGGNAPPTAELEGFKVHYLGLLRNDEAMASIYAAADVFVAPSLVDTLPSTVIEAMAVGIPVVAYDAGGIPEIVDDGVNGLLAPVGQPDRLADALGRMLGDAAFSIGCGQRAREKVLRTFAKEDAARAYAELYAELLRKK
jgi:glycosyltransferase involved in cell wall biosynthesis